MRLVVLALSVLALAGCDAISYPPRSSVYRPALAAVKAAKDLPAGAAVDPRNNAEVYIAKNAAYAIIPFDVQDASGHTTTDSYTVHLKRITRRWEIETCQRSLKVEAPLAAPVPMPVGVQPQASAPSPEVPTTKTP